MSIKKHIIKFEKIIEKEMKLMNLDESASYTDKQKARKEIIEKYYKHYSSMGKISGEIALAGVLVTTCLLFKLIGTELSDSELYTMVASIGVSNLSAISLYNYTEKSTCANMELIFANDYINNLENEERIRK